MVTDSGVERSASKVIHFRASSGAKLRTLPLTRMLNSDGSIGQAGLRSRKSAFGCRAFRIAIRHLDHGDEPVSDFGVAPQFKFGDIKEITNVTGLVRGHRDQ